MKTLLTAALVALVGATLMAQGNLTVPYTADQLLGVKYAFAISDPNDDNETEADVTNAEAATYGTALCTGIWDTFVAQRDIARELEKDIRSKFLGLPDADQDAVEAYIDACIASGVCA